MRTKKSAIQRFAEEGSAVAPCSREAHVQQLTAELPEARVIKSILDDHTARVITFELLTQER